MCGGRSRSGRDRDEPELVRRGVDHVVLERDEVASTWRSQRWDNFRLNTSDWMNDMLGPMQPGAFPGRDEVVARLHSLADGLPVRAGTPVEHVRRGSDGFSLLTADAEVRADSVVVASGLLNVPKTPAAARELPDDVLSINGADFRCADALPSGAVLVVGGGQSGVQIAEDLASAGRRVLLSTCPVGRFNWNYRGRETFLWLDDLGFWTQRPVDLPDPAMMRTTQPLVGSGGRTLSLPMLAGLGVMLLGRLTDVVDGRAVFDESGAANVAFGDQRWSATCELIDAYIAAHGLDAAAPRDDEGGGDVRHRADRLAPPRGCRRLHGHLVHRLHRRPHLPGPAGAGRLRPGPPGTAAPRRSRACGSPASRGWSSAGPASSTASPSTPPQTVDQITEYLVR